MNGEGDIQDTESFGETEMKELVQVMCVGKLALMTVKVNLLLRNLFCFRPCFPLQVVAFLFHH